MAMLRQSSLNQLKRINDEIKKQGGTTDRRSDSEKGMPNAMWMHDPIDADKSGKRKIATFDQMYSIDIPDADTKVTMKNENLVPRAQSRDLRFKSPKLDIREINKKIDELVSSIKKFGVLDVKIWVEMGYTRFVICLGQDVNDNKIQEIKNLFDEEEIVDEIEYTKWFEDNNIEIENCYYIVADRSYSLDWYSENMKINNKNMKLNEGKIKNAIVDAVESYYLDGTSPRVIDTISNLCNIDPDRVEEILINSDMDSAMDNLMEPEMMETKSHIMTFDKMFENGPNDTPQEIMKNMKTIANWHSEDSPKKEMNQLMIGKYIDNGKVKGYINRIEGNIVFVDSIVEPLGLTKIKLKDAVKGYKPEKQNSVSDFAIEGPNNKSLGGALKGGGGYSPKVDAKGQVASDQKISNKINKEKSIKSFTDMSKEFDSKTISKKNSPVAPKIDKKADKAKDNAITNKNNKEKKISKLTDLSQEMKNGKPSKSQNEPGTTIDKKSEKSGDNSITKKNSKVKKFSDLKSNIQTGPNKKK